VPQWFEQQLALVLHVSPTRDKTRPPIGSPEPTTDATTLNRRGKPAKCQPLDYHPTLRASAK